MSADSAVLSIVAATVPSPPSAPTTSVSSDTLTMTIDWNAPSDNGGIAVTGYRVYILASNGSSWYQDLVNCDAVNDSTIISATSCTIPTSTLRASPFSLTSGTSIYARVLAINGIGDSKNSSSGNGGVLPNAATVPDAPINLARDAANTSKTQLAITWSAGASNGGTVVIDYSVYWD